MTKIVVVTTSLGTKWESYSQTLLKMCAPEWTRVVVDGRTNWSPVGFLEKIWGTDADYVLHVDEDCFVLSRESLLELVDLLEKEPNIAAAGIPDGGCFYRERNPAALNLFFVLFRTAALKTAWASGSTANGHAFRHDFASEVNKQCPNLDKSRMNWDNEEPYYSLYWNILANGGKFLYLTEELNTFRWSSKVSLPSGGVLAEHMWYLRSWFSQDVMSGHDCTNISRYRNMQHYLHKKYRTNLSFWTTLAYMHFRRIIRRIS